MIQPRQSEVRNRLLATLAADDFARLCPALEHVPLRLHETVLKPHQPIEHAYFVESGLCSYLADTHDGRIEIGLVGPEGMVGTPLVLGADRVPFTVLVQGEGEALRIPAVDLCAALDASPALRGLLGRYVQSFIAQVGGTAYANAELTIEARLARWLLMYQDRMDQDDLPITHEFLSLMLGVRRPGVTTATHVLEAGGMIQARRGHITVLNREKLESMVGDTYGAAEAEYERLIADA
ncbi:Crp/Fnr family transcriptional regulator [Methylobacterium sp. J-001]|uniref:Crp/Fnr family transcriptional regulator n=1 Tax=Methylobacterium sp. J-001 TaxID=2836609 RepID=UPI001FB92A14|nr:Crp/Fnr family transcriptional regulator [Methylobacterium sp. J-001]MCJ2116570.1 Crp/Fnr family transcriptional regulator [Methylobacterium sp. J-001]